MQIGYSVWGKIFSAHSHLLISRGGGTPGNSWWEYVIRFSKSWSYFRPKNATSSPGCFALALEVGPGKSALGTRLQKMNPFSDLASKKLCHPYLDQNTSKNHFLKSISNSHISLSFFLINSFINSCSSLENHTRFQSKMGKVYTCFQTRTAQKPYPLERHIPIWLIQGSTPPG